MWQRITALGFPPLYSERTARIPQESGRCSWAGRVVCSPQIPPAMMALYPERLWGAMSPLEELAYLKARNAYLEELVAAQKNSVPHWRTQLYH